MMELNVVIFSSALLKTQYLPGSTVPSQDTDGLKDSFQLHGLVVINVNEMCFQQDGCNNHRLNCMLQSAKHFRPSQLMLFVCVCVFVICSVMSDSLRPHRLELTRLLCRRNSPRQDTGLGTHSLLQGTILTLGSNLGILHCRKILYSLSHQGNPVLSLSSHKNHRGRGVFHRMGWSLYQKATSPLQGRKDQATSQAGPKTSWSLYFHLGSKAWTWKGFRTSHSLEC